jgi:imidazolonepropionase-like amidohydrolase/cyclophilin family peptidyl-prolyl cis-trans isomerase/HEAT repeat protein
MKRLAAAAAAFLLSAHIVAGTASRSGEPTIAALALAADRRATSPGDLELIEIGLVNRSAELRRFAVLSLGRLERPALVTTIAPLLNDPDPSVRAEAAAAIGQALHTAAADTTPPGRGILTARLTVERDVGVIAVVLRTLGRLRHDPVAAADVATLLIGRTRGSIAETAGAVQGLESVIRRAPKLPVSDAVRARLRELALAGRDAGSGGDAAALVRVRRLALQALLNARDDDVATIEKASGDPDWQVRRIAVLMMNPAVEVFGPGLMRARRDEVFQVRLEALRVGVRGGAQSKGCRMLIDALNDPALPVIVQAIDLITPACPEKGDVVSRLKTIASTLGASGGSPHVAAHALVSLAAVSRDDARPLLARAMAHPEWHVRTAAARAAAAAQDDAALLQLARDRASVVQEAALAGLAAMKSATVAEAAIAALQSDDHHVLRTAATVLAGTPARDRAVPALLAALDRLTKSGADTSRDPRVAMLRRLQELGAAEVAPRVSPLLRDFDRSVAALAADVIGKWTGARPEPQPTMRPLATASESELTSLPRRLVLHMNGGGEVEMELFPDVAPLTVARITRLARRGYYNGLTFHRIAANFVVQGGSPGASEYVGDARYMRDEISLLSHERGTIGVSTRGRDTGDAQIFVNLVDSPRLDYDYTIFGRVSRGMDVVDRMLEGATIRGTELFSTATGGSGTEVGPSSGPSSVPESPQTVEKSSVPLVLRFGSLIDGSGAVTPNAIVVVRGERVVSVSTDAATIPAGATVIDLRRFTGLPGLIDAHTHMTYYWDGAAGTRPLGQPRRDPETTATLAAANARRTLETGVTTVRDLGASGGADFLMRDRIAGGAMTGPRMFAAGQGISAGRGGAGPDALRAQTEARIKAGADWVKVYASRGSFQSVDTTQTLTFDQMKAIVDTAHAMNRPVAVHSYGPAGVKDAVRAGADSIEHGIDLDDETLADMARRGTVWVPTIDHNRYYVDARDEYGFALDSIPPLQAYIARNLESTRRAVEAGVRIAMGSDAVFSMFGQNTRELEWFVKAGMTPAQAIASATTIPAAMLGREHELGCIAPGCYADIAAVDGNPSTDIRALITHVKWVMKGGAVVVDKR